MEQGLTVVVDYHMGNLGSITKALEYVGGRVLLSDHPEDLRKANRIVLPGVGAFGDGMKNLRELGFILVLEEEVLKKRKPFLGVCLGMQLLVKKSYEFGEYEGLGWIDAEVRLLKVLPLVGGTEGGYNAPRSAQSLKVPHVGWNNVTFRKDHSLLQGIKSGADFYFVHSYHIIPNDPSVVVGTVDYGGEVVAIIARDNIFATQFHPEKSQKDGLQMLKNFLMWTPSRALL